MEMEGGRNGLGCGEMDGRTSSPFLPKFMPASEKLLQSGYVTTKKKKKVTPQLPQ